MTEEVKIKSDIFWFKVVEFLQQNWALIEQNENGSCRVYFIHDRSGVFDELEFPTLSEAEQALRRNGFGLYSDDKQAQKFIAAPNPPFYRASHPNGRIYSSGRFWH